MLRGNDLKQVIMETTNKAFQVQSILFESNDNEVLLKGLMVKGVMRYESELLITQTQLNQVLNMLQRKNDDISIYDFIQREPMFDGQSLYSADFTTLRKTQISLHTLTTVIPLKQIRA
jgi:hypothetical protein